MFRPYEYWRHDYTRDIDIEIIKVQYNGPDYIRARVNFINRSHTGYFELNSKVKILRKDFHLWKKV